MSEFSLYIKIGLHHVLDIHAYDHILFLTALVVPYTFKNWKKILTLVSVFTLGHTAALLLSAYGKVKFDITLIEFLIPVTILSTAIYNLVTLGKTTKKSGVSAAAFITLFFGIIHGLGFSNYFNFILSGNSSDKVIPLLGFSVGIELAQLAVVLTVLVISFLIQNFVRNAKKNWIIITSSIIIGVVIPMLIESEIWKK